jgi:hypothetical protein
LGITLTNSQALSPSSSAVGQVGTLVVLDVARAAEGSAGVDEVTVVSDKALAATLDHRRCGDATNY